MPARPLRCSLAIALAAALAAGEASWPFTPEPDRFAADAALDLRSLNERVAGERGWIAVSPDGDLLRGDRTPIRFWAINNSTVAEPLAKWSDHPPRDLARHARWIAKRGVNLGRCYLLIEPRDGEGRLAADPSTPNPARVDAIRRYVATMKAEGIYTLLTPLWPQTMRLPAGWGIAGPDGQSANGLIFFNERLQALYKQWLKELLTKPNPHAGGLPLAQDPALAFIQILNEDSLLFWTAQGISREQQRVLGARFAAWARTAYGSLDAALKAWGGPFAGDKDRIGDDPAAGILGLHILWMHTSAAPPQTRRLRDELRFTAELQRGFYAMMAEFLRRECGYRGLINGSNWKTADERVLGDIERWTYEAGDAAAVNRYTGGDHQGDPGMVGWAVRAGDRYRLFSCLTSPREFPLALRHPTGRPMLVTESQWVTPTRWQAEGPLMVAAYGSLTGLDAFFWFDTSASEWMPPASANGFLKDSLGKWVCATPEQVGMFPAAALIHRQGLVRRGRPVLVDRPGDQLFARRVPPLPEASGFDANRDAKRTGPGAAGRIDPLAFLVGPVAVDFRPGQPSGEDPAPSIDAAAGVVRANTGELVLDHRRGLLTISTTQAQAVIGFPDRAGPPIATADAAFTIRNRYAAVALVALDGKPLRESRRILLQVGTESRPTGWTEQEQGDGLVRITSLGRAPWAVAAADGEVRLRNPGISRAAMLDPNLMRGPALAVRRDGDALVVPLPDRALYAIIE